MTTLAAERAAYILAKGYPITIDGKKSTGVMSSDCRSNQMYLLSIAQVQRGSVIDMPASPGTWRAPRRWLVTAVHDHIGYKAANLIDAAYTFNAYDPISGELVASGPLSNEPLTGYLVPAACAPPVGSLFGSVMNPRTVTAVVIDDGIAKLTLGPTPPELA